ncbi:MAG: ribosomal protein S18-alanine N-acetyltransferase [Candidatus Omnitrophota bacterium]
MEKALSSWTASAMKFRFRSMRLYDVPQVYAIEVESFSDPWSERIFLEDLQDRGYNRTLVAEEAETCAIAGYCCFWVFPNDEAHINNIAIHPARRRIGLAEALLKQAINVGLKERIHSVTLEVRVSNEAAIAFYKKLGFQEEGRRKDYYVKPKEDALIYRLML